MGWYMDWTELAQDRDQWRALTNTVMKLNKILRNYWVAERLVGSQKGVELHGVSMNLYAICNAAFDIRWVWSHSWIIHRAKIRIALSYGRLFHWPRLPCRQYNFLHVALNRPNSSTVSFSTFHPMFSDAFIQYVTILSCLWEDSLQLDSQH
jgi:hypothetical protein